MGGRRLSKKPKEVFLSHSSKDKSAALKLAGVLRAHGVRVWYSEKHIEGAKQWHDEIGKALKRCDWFCVLLTPEAVEAKWVKRELLYALQDDRYKDRVVPILLKACDTDSLSWVLSSLQMIKFSRRFHEGCRELLRLWGIRYDRAATSL
jgi:hypothetical protein